MEIQQCNIRQRRYKREYVQRWKYEQYNTGAGRYEQYNTGRWMCMQWLLEPRKMPQCMYTHECTAGTVS